MRHRLSLSSFDSQSDAAFKAVLSAAETDSVLVVVNQVSRAIRLWNRLKDETSNATHLLHSRFHALDRSKKESDLRPTPGMILVSTQAVEVSLDLDFDRCFTEIAPIESIAQRFGRCNRRGDQREPAPISVFLQFPEGSSPCAPYEEAHMVCVRKALEQFCGEEVPNLGDADVQELLEASYTDENRERLRNQASEKIKKIDKSFVEEWQPLGITSADDCRRLEEQWGQLFEGKEV